MNALATQSCPSVGLVERRYATWLEPLVLESGVALGPITLAYETYGKLNASGDNAILLLHALSGDAHAAGWQAGDTKPGWWNSMVGPGRPFDTDRYFVICSNVLGGCQGSTGPSSSNPATGRPYAARFPVLTIGDMVQAQARLLERVRGAILLATSARSSPQTLAWNAIGRRAIMSDPRWRGGDYYDSEPPADGLAVARMIGHITYLSEPSLERKFGRAYQDGGGPAFTLEREFAIESYLDYQGTSFNARFDANTYLYITKAMDYWDLPARYGSLDAALARSHATFLLLSFTSDWLYPTSESVAIADALWRLGRPVTHAELASSAGHDAF